MPAKARAAAALLCVAASAAAAGVIGGSAAAPDFPAEWLWWCPFPPALLGVRALVACVPLLPLEANVSGGDSGVAASRSTADEKTRDGIWCGHIVIAGVHGLMGSGDDHLAGMSAVQLRLGWNVPY